MLRNDSVRILLSIHIVESKYYFGGISLKKELAIEKLTKQASLIDILKEKERFSPEFKKWHRDTQVVIEKIFGGDTRHIKDFNAIHYTFVRYSTRTPEYKFQEMFIKGLEAARSIINSLIQEIDEYWDDNETQKQSDLSELEKIRMICERFHLVARQLRSRHADRDTLDISDEYDVQDLFHALLTIYFDDIRDEEWTPSYAGSNSRVDFLLKQEEVVVEIKKTRKGLGSKELGEQLIIDIQRYQVHPSCKALVCFVYDPEGRIVNPRGIENDLNKEIDDFVVYVIITPKGI